jgi:RHS repeat-associated protein
MVYKKGTLDIIQVDGGYIKDGQYYFYLQDHLGSNRVVADANGNVVQTNHYYPYGTPFAESYNQDVQKYKYIGKEYDTENGLNLYDFEARQMDGLRFTTMDPLAEKYYSMSPYAYCSANPVNRIDPTGMNDDWYRYKDKDGNWIYKWSADIHSQGDLNKVMKEGEHLGFTFTDTSTNTYYSLFGKAMPSNSSLGELYQKLDNGIIGQAKYEMEGQPKDMYNSEPNRPPKIDFSLSKPLTLRQSISDKYIYTFSYYDGEGIYYDRTKKNAMRGTMEHWLDRPIMRTGHFTGDRQKYPYIIFQNDTNLDVVSVRFRNQAASQQLLNTYYRLFPQLKR